MGPTGVGDGGDGGKEGVVRGGLDVRGGIDGGRVGRRASECNKNRNPAYGYHGF